MWVRRSFIVNVLRSKDEDIELISNINTSYTDMVEKDFHVIFKNGFHNHPAPHGSSKSATGRCNPAIEKAIHSTKLQKIFFPHQNMLFTSLNDNIYIYIYLVNIFFTTDQPDNKPPL